MQKVGVIDLGTNTFHLLIAEAIDGAFQPLFRERVFVKLAEDGIGRIGPAAYQRGLETLASFQRNLEAYGVERVRAIGTAALRTAANGVNFIRDVAEQTGIQIELIDGQEEARLIHLGVRQVVPFEKYPNMIMDIGGGSVEFIIADRDQVFWAESFPVGVAVLYRRFHHHEPILASEIAAIDAFLDQQFQSLKAAIQRYGPQDLVGASGTFDVLENKLELKQNGSLLSQMTAADFFPLYEQLIPMTQEQRLATDGIPASRVDMIIVALILLKKVLELQQPQHILISAFAMKEGVLAEME